MTITREQIIKSARKWLGVRWSHQGRTRRTGVDCGGLLIVLGHELGLSSLEELGYSSFPTNGRFDELLAQELDKLKFKSSYPHARFDGSELIAGDLLSYDYENGEGTRHVSLVTRWDGSRFWVLESLSKYGVCEHPFAYPFSEATVQGWRVRL